MLLHSIGKMSPPGTASPWLRKYIFPGAYSPALSEVFPATESNRLWVTDLEFLRVHYATTLRALAGAVRGEPRGGRRDVRRALLPDVGVLPDQRRDDVPHRRRRRCSTCSSPRRRDAAPIVRDYVVAEQERLARVETERGLRLA